MTAWSKNDELFFKELKSGHAWQRLPALFFELHGFDVKIPELRIRDNIKEASKWIDTVDLLINGLQFEIKSRNEIFTSPTSFPYNSIFVDTVSGFDSKTSIPFAYLMISRSTGSMLWLSTESKNSWTIEEKFDRVRRIREQFYTAGKDLLQPLSSLVEKIRRLT